MVMMRTSSLLLIVLFFGAAFHISDLECEFIWITWLWELAAAVGCGIRIPFAVPMFIVRPLWNLVINSNRREAAPLDACLRAGSGSCITLCRTTALFFVASCPKISQQSENQKIQTKQDWQFLQGDVARFNTSNNKLKIVKNWICGYFERKWWNPKSQVVRGVPVLILSSNKLSSLVLLPHKVSWKHCKSLAEPHQAKSVGPSRVIRSIIQNQMTWWLVLQLCTGTNVSIQSSFSENFECFQFWGPRHGCSISALGNWLEPQQRKGPGNIW